MSETMIVVDWPDCTSNLFATFSSQRYKVEVPHYPQRCSDLRSYISKQFWGCALLSTRKDKHAIHYYQQVPLTYLV